MIRRPARTPRCIVIAGPNGAGKTIFARDAFAATAKERKAGLVTGNPEFKALEKEIRITWLKETKWSETWTSFRATTSSLSSAPFAARR